MPENFAQFENLIKDFCVHIGQTIKSSKKLAEMMAGKARLLSDVIEKALTSDEENSEDSTLKDQMNAFKDILIHDITPKGFADVYAQTIAYGMFAARLHDPSLANFSRQEAAELIPLTNEWKNRGLKEGQQFATLTDIITKAWSDKTTKEYKVFP